jgi:hypothetical protein
MRDRRNNPHLRRCFGSLGVVSSVPHRQKMAAGLPLLAKFQSRLEDVKKLTLLILLGFSF